MSVWTSTDPWQGKRSNVAGQPAARQPTVLLQGLQVVAQTHSDAAGRFVFPQVRSGVYQISSGTTCIACRVWTKAAAPPAAQGHVVLRAETDVVRGQQPISHLFTNPLVVGLIVAAAVAIPLAVRNRGGDEGS